jgi:hypothetical protein
MIDEERGEEVVREIGIEAWNAVGSEELVNGRNRRGGRNQRHHQIGKPTLYTIVGYLN